MLTIFRPTCIINVISGNISIFTVDVISDSGGSILIKRITTLFLVVCIIFSFVACSGNGSGNDNKRETMANPSVTSKDDIVYEEDDLPDSLDFGGESITILVLDEKDDGISDGEILADELTSDIINDSIYNRELFVETRLGVEIVPAKVEQNNYNIELDKMFNADDNLYQICAAKTVSFAPYSFDKVLTDLYAVEYIDLDKPWWSQYFAEKAEVEDCLYLSTGTLALSLTRFLFVVFYNKQMAEDYSLTYPELTELYSIVENGDWTYDLFYSLGSEIYSNVNGDNERDVEDVYGIGFLNGIDIDTIWSSFDLNIYSRTEDGWFEFDMNTDKVFAALEKIRVLIHETDGCFVPELQSDGGLDDLSEKFASGSLLFMVNKIHAAESSTLRNMQDEYGIIPFPKYDSHQKDYYSYAHDQYLSFAIPVTNPNPDIAAAVLEAMASYSYRETHPAYLDIALKGKYMSDIQSRRMIDRIVAGFKLDSSWIFAAKFGNIGEEYRNSVGANSSSYSQQYAKIKKQIETRFKVARIEFNKK